MTDFANADGWVGRLPLWARLLAMVGIGILILFLVGVLAGVGARFLEEGRIRALGAALALAALVGMPLLGWLMWRLSTHWRRPGRSVFERRYTRMWLMLIGLGLPVGLVLGAIDQPGGGVPGLFSNGPLAPGSAILVAIALGLLMIVSFVIYHRAIDDHEQQAYLWANSIAFYFLVIALPVAWLLARGGLIPPVDIGTALLILLGAVAINLIVWLKLKFF